MEKNFNGRVLIDDMYEDLKVAVCNVLIANKIDHIQAFKNYGVSRVDLHGLITGRGNKMPLARLFMFAADLGIKVTVQVEEPKDAAAKPKRAAKPERKRKESEPEPDFEPELDADSEFEDEPVRKRKKRT